MSTSASPADLGRPPFSLSSAEQRGQDSSDPCLHHLEDLKRLARPKTWRASLQYYAKQNTACAFATFVLATLSSWIWTLVLSPATVFSDPLGTLAALLFYPVIWTGLGAVVLVFWLLGLVGGQRIIDWLSRRYAGGLGVVNWLNPQIFGPSSVKAFEEARGILGGHVPTTVPQQVSIFEENPDFASLKTVRLFSLPLARTLLLMSSLVYERNDTLVRQAADIAFHAEQTYHKASESYKQEMKKAQDVLLESERVIKEQAARWGLAFDGVSDLATIGGPFASIFYTPFGDSKQKPFIALVFKGTGPSNFAEFLTISRVSSNVFFGPGSGSAHQGFYTDLFMTNDPESSGDGYGSIVRTLKHVAARMKREYPDADARIPLFVAGHNLGEDLELRDCYSFGTPRLGSGEFASAVEQTLITPLDRPNILWRCANANDIVTRIPPGLSDNESSRSYIPDLSVLNYAYLGPALRLVPSSFPHRFPYYRLEQINAFHEATEVRVVDEHEHGDPGRTDDSDGRRQRSAKWRSVDEDDSNPLRWLLALLPGPLYDHFPNSYLQHIHNIETSAEQAARKREKRRQRAEDAPKAGKSLEQWTEDVKAEAVRKVRQMGGAARS
ncbi:hypothetical protein JCM10213v2_007488 [Rhodosporidiobolus nylandii]